MREHEKKRIKDSLGQNQIFLCENLCEQSQRGCKVPYYIKNKLIKSKIYDVYECLKIAEPLAKLK